MSKGKEKTVRRVTGKAGKATATASPDELLANAGAESPVVEEVSAAPKEAAPEIPTVDASTTQSDSVQVTMLRQLDPACSVGRWDGRRALGVPRMEVGRQYVVPRNVADHLIDCRAAIPSAR